jgi:hypothetical protein
MVASPQLLTDMDLESDQGTGQTAELRQSTKLSLLVVILNQQEELMELSGLVLVPLRGYQM